MVDVGYLDLPPGLIDAVHDAVAPPSRRTQAGERPTQRTADPVRLFGQRPEDELHTRRADLLGKS